MEEQLMNCSKCGVALVQESGGSTCKLCGELHCAECLNEAGYCVPCDSGADYSKEEAIVA